VASLLRTFLARFRSDPVQPPPPEETQPETHENATESVQTPEPLPEVPPQPAGVLLGKDSENGDNLIFPAHLRNRHCYLIGKTRTGKTTLIKNMLVQDMKQGHGLCFIDPHGDAAEELLATVPPERIPDVIYFDPSRTYSPSFNFLRLPYPPYKLTEDVVSVMKLFFAASWGQRMEHMLRFSVLTLLTDTEHHTLPDLRRLCVSPDYRDAVAARVTDPLLREFWEQEFPNIPKDAFSPIVNKLSAFLLPGSPLLRVFSDPANDLDFSAIMNEQKILIVNLAKGILSDEPSRLLGGLIVTGIQQAALARADIPSDQRKEFHLYIDEFQNFITDSVATILSESAKYKLYLTLAHQTLGQLPGDIERSIFGNIATIISFQISAEDAGKLRREMKSTRYRIRNRHDKTPYPLSVAIESEKRRIEETMGFDNKKRAERVAELQQLEANPRSVARGEYSKRVASLRERIATSDDLLQLGKEKIAELQNLTAKEFISEYSPPSSKTADYELEEYPSPDPDDFINMQARHALCRIERAENVTAFHTVAPSDPTPGTRGQILHAMRERHAEHMKAKPEPRSQAQPPPAQEEPKRKSKARILKTPNVKKPPKPKKKSTADLSK